MRELTKSRDKKLAGVAGGLGEYFGVDKTLMRGAWLLAGIIFFAIPVIVAYFVLAMIMPEAKYAHEQVIDVDPPRPEEPVNNPNQTTRRLTKSRDRWISGVAAGIAEYFSIDPVLVRALFLVSVVVGVGSGLLVYIILAIVMPAPQYQYR